MIPSTVKPMDCHYTDECLERSIIFEPLTIGSGCIDCTLTNSEECGYRITRKEWDDIQALPEVWLMIAHCNLRLENQPSAVLDGEGLNQGE